MKRFVCVSNTFAYKHVLCFLFCWWWPKICTCASEDWFMWSLLYRSSSVSVYAYDMILCVCLCVCVCVPRDFACSMETGCAHTHSPRMNLHVHGIDLLFQTCMVINFQISLAHFFDTLYTNIDSLNVHPAPGCNTYAHRVRDIHTTGISPRARTFLHHPDVHTCIH